jgi:hypothetical protein
VREITAAEAQIEWEVHLANRKAAAPKFFDPSGRGRRNEEIDESKLIIDAGSQKASGAGQGMKRLQERFMDAVDVPLGDLLTDSAGRLIVLGGFGNSQFFSPGGEERHIDNFADNDSWCDDTSDGPVRATIRLNGTTEAIEADSAWVIVAPPDFAPPIENVVTLYDVVYDMMAKSPPLAPSLAMSDDTRVSFTKDIYPILRRVSNMHWVSKFAAGGHSRGSAGHFISMNIRDLSNPQKAQNTRGRIFRRLTIPESLRKKRGDEGNPLINNMPKLPTGDPTSGLSLTEQQYLRMERWALGGFENDWPEDGEPPTPLSLDELSDMEKPQALDRAALEACVGGGFFPGIEVGRIMLEDNTYDRNRPFRINALLSPGTLTARMAVPWQADFLSCRAEDSPADPDNLPDIDWWPGQRPSQVFRGQSQEQVEWTPPAWGFLTMMDNWSKLGFVVEKIFAGQVEYVEDERILDDGG